MAAKLSLLCLLLELCTGCTECSGYRSSRNLLKLCLESNLCRHSSSSSWCAHSSALGMVLSLFPHLQAGTRDRKQRLLWSTVYNTWNPSESKWRPIKTARLLTDALGYQTTALPEAVHREMAKFYRIQTQSCSFNLTPLISKAGLTAGHKPNQSSKTTNIFKLTCILWGNIIFFKDLVLFYMPVWHCLPLLW